MNTKLRIRILFLKTYFKERLIPCHLIKLLKYQINLHIRSSAYSIDRLKQNFIHKLLRVELKDAYKCLSRLQFDLFKNYRNINSILPYDICDLFFRRQEFIFERNWYKENVNIDRKIEKLRLTVICYNYKYCIVSIV